MQDISEEIAGNIKLIVSDIDGTLTDGRIFIDEDGKEGKTFSVRDGLAAHIWIKLGGKLAMLTGRSESKTVLRRAKEMMAEDVMFSSQKHRDILVICSNLGVTLEETAFIGDELNDIKVMNLCALSVAVSDAVIEVRAIADIVLKRKGGDGALRELIEIILKAQGKWNDAMKLFL